MKELIILGDLNVIRDSEKDKIWTQEKVQPDQTPGIIIPRKPDHVQPNKEILDAILDNSVVDMYRNKHPKDGYTYSTQLNEEKYSNSRIDYIFASRKIQELTYECSTFNANELLYNDSEVLDHYAVILRFTNPIINPPTPKGNFTERVPDTEKASKEDWENYRKELITNMKKIKEINEDTLKKYRTKQEKQDWLDEATTFVAKHHQNSLRKQLANQNYE